jgi:hypothetical protein
MKIFNVETPQKFSISCEPNKPMVLEVNGDPRTLIEMIQFAMKHDPRVEAIIIVASSTYEWMADGISTREVNQQ